MRLLVVASTFPARRGDGTPSFVWDLADRLSGSFDITVLAPMVPGAKRRERAGTVDIVRFRYFIRRFEDLADGAILENLRAKRSRWLQVLPFLVAEAVAMRRVAARIRPDLVHVHWLIPQGIVARVALPRVPQVVTTLGGDLYALQGTAGRAAKAVVARHATAVTVMSEDMRRRVLALGAPADHTFIIPMGAEVDAVRASAANVQREPGRILFAGRFVAKKGMDVLFDALPKIGRPWRLEIVGAGPLERQVAERARPFGDRITFSGTLPRDQLAEAMARCSVFVLPSIAAPSGDQDGLPVVLLEAMAAGCPIVASKLPGIDEAIDDGATGVLVAPGDAGALAAALDRVLEDPGRSSRLGRAAAVAVDAYSVDAIAKRYAQVLEAAVD